MHIDDFSIGKHLWHYQFMKFLSLVAQSFNPSTEMQSISLWVEGLPSLPSEFQAIQGYTVRPCGERERERNLLGNKSTITKLSPTTFIFLLWSLSENVSFPFGPR